MHVRNPQTSRLLFLSHAQVGLSDRNNRLKTPGPRAPYARTRDPKMMPIDNTVPLRPLWSARGGDDRSATKSRSLQDDHGRSSDGRKLQASR